MKEYDSEVSLLSFFIKKQFIITVMVIIALSLLYPFFGKVIERMRLSSLYNKMQKIATAQINYEIGHNAFTNDFKNLDLKIKDNNDQYLSGEDAHLGNFIVNMGTKGLFGVHNKRDYFVYYDYKNSSFHCAPGEHHICKNIAPISKEICEEANMLWSTKNNTCYTREKDMCLALSMPWDTKSDNVFCGYTNLQNMQIYQGGTCIGSMPSGCQNSIVYTGATCEGKSSFACVGSDLRGGTCIAETDTACHSVQIHSGAYCIVSEDYLGSYGCQNTIINKGGACIASGNGNLGCHKPLINNGGICMGNTLQSCNNATVLFGGICEANALGACQEITVKNGGRCIANTEKTCTGSYDKGACCHGDYCPEDSPKCNCPGFAKVC